MNKVAFFSHVPLTRQHYQRLGVEIFRSRGMEVEHLDMTSLFNPGYTGTTSSESTWEDVRTTHVRTSEDLDAWLAGNPNTIGIDLLSLNAKTGRFYRALKRFGVTYLQASVSARPWPAIATRLFHFESLKRKLSLSYLYDQSVFRMRQLLADHSEYYQRPRYVLRGGRKDFPQRPLASKTTSSIWAHTFDYDIYLKTSRQKAIGGKPLAVFLDEYFPYHPDNKDIPGSALAIVANAYYAQLNRVFDRVEADLACEVVIAAHPRANYAQDHPGLLRGRRVESGMTNEWVAQASLVLAHASTSVNFAVLHKKPVAFLTSGAIENSWYGPHIAAMAGELGKTPIDMSRSDFDFKSELAIDVAKYQVYRENYIKLPGTPEKRLWDIVIDNLPV